MKKILLTSIFGLMTLVPNMANARVAMSVLYNALEKFSDDLIDKNKFVSKIGNAYITLDEVAAACLNSCKAGVDEVATCMDLIDIIRLQQEDAAQVAKDQLDNYIVDGIKPNKDRKLAIASNGKFYVAHVYIPENIKVDLGRNVAVFKTDNDKFICALGGGAGAYFCAPNKASQFYFKFSGEQGDRVNKLEIREMSELSPFDKKYYFTDAFSFSELKSLIIGGAEWHNTIQIIDAYSSSTKDLNSAYEIVSGQERRKCLDSMGVPGLSFVGAADVQESCNGDICTITVDFGRMHKVCTYNRLNAATEYLKAKN